MDSGYKHAGMTRTDRAAMAGREYAGTTVGGTGEDVGDIGGNVQDAGANVRDASGNVRDASGNVRHASGNVRHASGNVRHASGNVRGAGGQVGGRVGWGRNHSSVTCRPVSWTGQLPATLQWRQPSLRMAR